MPVDHAVSVPCRTVPVDLKAPSLSLKPCACRVLEICSRVSSFEADPAFHRESSRSLAGSAPWLRSQLPLEGCDMRTRVEAPSATSSALGHPCLKQLIGYSIL